MNISDSPLFKEFARPILVPEPRRGRAFYSPLTIVDTFVQHLLDTAKLEATRFKISNATENTIDTMESDISFNGSSFGKVRLPRIQTSYWGTSFAIQEQQIVISNP
ncbi:hypothetical protein ACLX1H_009803 [Fusarium chlamydosporum]